MPAAAKHSAGIIGLQGSPEEELNRVFAALADPVRRAILDRLGEGPLLVSQIAAPFDISLQAVSRHISVLVRAGMIRQARSGRISRCSIDVSPVFKAAVWINSHTKYWQAQFDALKDWLGSPDAPAGKPARKSSSGRSKR